MKAANNLRVRSDLDHIRLTQVLHARFVPELILNILYIESDSNFELKLPDLVMKENVEAVHHVGGAGVIQDVVQVSQQEVETVLRAGTRGEGRVVGVTVTRLVGPQVQQDGAPEVRMTRGRHVVFAPRARPLSPAPGVAVTPEVGLSLVVDGQVLVSPGEAIVLGALSAGQVLVVNIGETAGFAGVRPSLQGGAGETPL